MKATAIQDAIRRATVLSPLKDSELAAVAGCGREHMNKFRNYRTGSSLETLCALAEFFGMEIVVSKPQDGAQ
jgi:hypothetical protein